MHLWQKDPYVEASIKGFMIYAIPTLQGDPWPEYTLVTPDDCKFPSLAELTEVIFPSDSGENDQVLLDDDKYIIHEAFQGTTVNIPA